MKDCPQQFKINVGLYPKFKLNEHKFKYDICIIYIYIYMCVCVCVCVEIANIGSDF